MELFDNLYYSLQLSTSYNKFFFMMIPMQEHQISFLHDFLVLVGCP